MKKLLNNYIFDKAMLKNVLVLVDVNMAFKKEYDVNG